MIQTRNYTISNIYFDGDGFRGPSCSMKMTRLVDNTEFTTILYNSGSYPRFGVYELNLSPTQSGPNATIYGFTGFGMTVSFGQYKYEITKNTQLLETGLLWVFGNNNTIY